jgi:nitrate reductase gamma subunit
MSILLWAIYPYLAAALLVGGLIWRYRYDKFGWTTRSSQIYEATILRWASPMFHFGMIAVLFGHIGGLLVPKSWTEAVGISEHTYHVMAASVGTVAGTFTIVGLGILVGRRRLTGAVFAATTKNDKTMYVVLGAVIALGLFATVRANVAGDGYDYRETVSPWLRSLFLLRPRIELMAGVPVAFQLHILTAFTLFAFWPFTRLVHAFSAPVGYLTRPYIVYRSRGPRAGLRPTRRGWDGPPTLPSARSGDHSGVSR